MGCHMPAHACHAQTARRANLSQSADIVAPPKSTADSTTSRLDRRGVRVVTDVERGMRWTQGRCETGTELRGRRSRVVLTPRCWRQVCDDGDAGPSGPARLAGDGGKKARSPGRARRKPLKPLRREGRSASAEPVCSCALCYCILRTRPRVQRAPGFPCTLRSGGASSCMTRASSRRELAKVCFLDLRPSPGQVLPVVSA
jgi:hypothetical protein